MIMRHIFGSEKQDCLRGYRPSRNHNATVCKTKADVPRNAHKSSHHHLLGLRAESRMAVSKPVTTQYPVIMPLRRFEFWVNQNDLTQITFEDVVVDVGF